MHKMEAKRLDVWEEIVGKLIDILPCEGDTMIIVSGRRYILLDFPSHLLGELIKNKGATVGVLKTDRGYALRVLQNKNVQRI
ncbi:MAG: hypothetical protein QW279_06070 [Candidatus Jordarchaeaceae archaeon]